MAEERRPARAPSQSARQSGARAAPSGRAAPTRDVHATMVDAEVDARMTAVATSPFATDAGEALTHEHPGRYEIRREFGRGGMSVVYLAFDGHVGREVAFKQLLPKVIEQAEQMGTQGQAMLARFMREARITGQLEHPSIVPVYEVGRREDGSLYYTQKLIRGRTLTKALRDAPDLPGRLKSLSHVKNLCQAIAYAHARGVIHRDIKPDNVMVGEFGESVVLDWGIARVLEDAQSEREVLVDTNDETQEGDVLGTPQYMSPEQAYGRQNEIDEQSDVWSLGAVLYELLTGVPPFQGKNPIQVILKVQKEPVIPVKQLCPEAPPELAAVAERALQRDKRQRYQKAKQLAEDIEAFQSGARVTAFEYSSWQLVKRFIKKNKTVSIVSLVAFLAILGALARTIVENRKARHNLSQALLEKSDAAGRELNWLLDLTYAAAAREEEDSAEARFRAVQRGPREIEPLWRLQLPASVEAVALSPDGKRIAAALGDHAVHVLDAANGRELARCDPYESAVRALVFSSDGQTVATSGADRTIRAFSVSSGCDAAGKALAQGHNNDIAFSPDGGLLAVADGTAVRLYEMPGLRPAAKLEGHVAQVTGVAFAPEGRALASADTDGFIRYWAALPQRLTGGKLEGRLLRGGNKHQAISRLGFLPGGRTIVYGSADETVRFVETAVDESQLARTNPRQGAILGVAMSGTDTFASLGADSSVVLYDGETMAPVARLPGDDATHTVSFSADGKLIASANRDGRLRLWRVMPGSLVVNLSSFKLPSGGRDAAGKVVKPPASSALAVGPTGKRVAIADARGKLQLWDLGSKQMEWEAQGPATPITGLAFSPDGKLLAVASKEELVHVFSASDGARSFQLEGHQGAVLGVEFSPDGKTLASSGADGTVRLWDVSGHKAKHSFPVGSPTYAVVWAHDGKRLAAGAEDGSVRVWDPRSAKVVKKIDGGTDAVLALAFSPHGHVLVAAGKDQAIRVLRPDSGALRSVWTGHGGRVYSLSFAPDGETVASASIDGTIRLWDVRTGRTMARFDRPPEARGAAFSRDGAWLVSIGEKPSLQLVELDDKKALMKPAKELSRRLKKYKLHFDGINLGDDVDALAPAVGKGKK